MSYFERVIEIYSSFPERNDFVPYEENGKLVIYYSTDKGLKKAKFLGFVLGESFVFKQIDQEEVLERIEDILSEEPVQSNDIEEESVEDILTASYDDAPIIKLVNQMIVNAVKKGASDIHFENRQKSFVVRFRVDGVLKTYRTFPRSLHDSIIARVKVMAQLDVAETRKPQDGRINIHVGNRDVDIRVSVVPSIYGEKAVLRILEKSRGLMSLDSIGMPQEWLKRYRQYINKPNGIILFTGPTGSGKTTTLYASLMDLDRDQKNIITIEDPVEYDIDGVTQVQVNTAVNLTFANALRSFLRQDPDVILVGEIRDEDTAKAAIQASLTGHLVFSTLHTTNAATAVARLIEMDIEPFLLSTSLLLVVGQRLVRRVCSSCAREVKVDETLKNTLTSCGVKLEDYMEGSGCDDCLYTGYQGRVPIFEFLEINDEIRRLINKKADAKAIEEAARNNGFKSMFEHGLELVEKGITTPQEVIAHTRE